MSNPVIPERWQDHYACIINYEVDDADLEKQLIEELAAAEAENRRLESDLKEAVEALRGMRKRWGKNRWCTDPECHVCIDEIAATSKADAVLAKHPTL